MSRPLAHRAIDLRSDTVTLPTARMLDAMCAARLGDDGLEGDPTVMELEALAAEMTGKEAALFVASGTMGNLVASLVHSGRGGEALVDEGAHIARSEGGGISRLAGLMCTRIPATDGEMKMDALRSAIRPQYSGQGLPTAMIVIETSHNHAGGRVPAMAYMEQVRALAQKAVIPVHIDGARIFNAAHALGVDVAVLAAFSDSMTFCLSKGLSAPMGSLLVGSRDFIVRARAFRRMVGGGLRQAGCVAAAGIVALQEMVERLAEDHRRADDLWRCLHAASPVLVGERPPQTNIVLLHLDGAARWRDTGQWLAELESCGVSLRARDSRTLRAVVHRHIDDSHVRAAADIVRACMLS